MINILKRIRIILYQNIGTLPRILKILSLFFKLNIH